MLQRLWGNTLGLGGDVVNGGEKIEVRQGLCAGGGTFSCACGPEV